MNESKNINFEQQDNLRPQTIQKGKELLNQLFMLIKTCQIHDPGNQAFVKPLQTIRDNINDFVKNTGSLAIETVEDNIYINEEKVRSTISTFSSYNFIIDEFEQKNIGGISFEGPITVEELKSFLLIFTKSNAPEDSSDTYIIYNDLLSKEMVESIRFLERRERSLASKDQAQVANQKTRALRNYVKAVEHVKHSMTRFAEQKRMDIRKAKRIVYNLVDISMDESFSFIGLSTIKNFDEYTFNHCVNVCIISIAFGQNLGLSRRQLGDLGMAGLYHDFGKLRIPLEVLNKRGQFNEEEWKLMRDHPIHSVKWLIERSGFSESDMKRIIAAYEHHMNYDRTGYPPLTANRELNFYSRVIAICDSYDAMTTERVYQKPKLPHAALRILLDAAGKKLDPLLTKAFINTVGIYPVGSLVRLTSGTLAIVCEVSSNPELLYLPSVITLKNEAGDIIKDKTVNLAKAVEKGQAIAIANALDPQQYRINISHYLLDVDEEIIQ